MVCQVSTGIVTMHVVLLILLLIAGVFNVKYEDTRSGRVWQGVIKYMIGALIETSDVPPQHKLLVSLDEIIIGWN